MFVSAAQVTQTFLVFNTHPLLLLGVIPGFSSSRLLRTEEALDHRLILGSGTNEPLEWARQHCTALRPAVEEQLEGREGPREEASSSSWLLSPVSLKDIPEAGVHFVTPCLCLPSPGILNSSALV